MSEVTKEAAIKDLREYVAQQIRMVRAKNRLSQKDVSERTGITRAAISKIESGESDIKLSTLAALCTALNFKVTIE